jgi:hypothetical protein
VKVFTVMDELNVGPADIPASAITGYRDGGAGRVPQRRLRVPVTTQHIGAAGELLVQYRLLKLGIDSARLTSDVGVDLSSTRPQMAARPPYRSRPFSPRTPRRSGAALRSAGRSHTSSARNS